MAIWFRGFPPNIVIEGRRFGSDRQPLGPMFEVRENSPTIAFETPVVSHSFSGGFIVTWCELPFLSENLVAQRFDAAGDKVGTPYIMVPGECDAMFSHSPQGGYRATWVKDGVLTVQHFVGTQTQGPPVAVAALPASGPRISHASDGSFVIVWEAGFDALMGRRFDANQNALGATFRVDGDAPPPVPPFGPPTPQRPRIAHAPDGKFAVAIERSIGGGQQLDAYFRVFNSDGTPLTDELQVTPTFTVSGNVHPEIAFDSDDGFFVVWQRAVQAYARRFAPSGAALTGEIVISSEPTVTADFNPAIVAQKGLFTAAWNDDTTGFVLARRFSTPSKVPSATPLGALALLVLLAATAARTLRADR